MKRAVLGPCLLVLVLGCGARADLAEQLGDGDPQSGAGPGAGASSANGSGADGSGAGSTGSQTSGAGATSGSGASSTGSDTTGAGGSSPSGSTGAGGASQVCPSFGTACSDCLSEACPDTWCHCSENPECFALFECFGDCSMDEGCQQECLAQHEDGISDALLVSDCAGSTCDPSCDWGNDIPPCPECIYENCEDEMNACLSQPSCLLLFNCLTDCGPLNLTCQEQCYQDFGAGTALLQAVLECSAEQCSDACP